MDVLFVQTGGTIDKDYPRLTKGYAFEITEPAIQRIMARVSPAFRFTVLPLLQKDSQDMTAADRKRIVEACVKAKQRHIVITHGTDTMLRTAAKLSTVQDKVIILTGAMRPERFKDSDADFNVGTAVGALFALPPGVYIAMSGCVLPWDKVERSLTSGQFAEKP